MDKTKLKLLVRQLEIVVDNIKAEILSDTESYMSMDTYEEIKKTLTYDEILDDDDGYPD
tara:strand:- start:381 stop:557 length:177 start_codon:yes stop_codon:yes gene_type:complete